MKIQTQVRFLTNSGFSVVDKNHFEVFNHNHSLYVWYGPGPESLFINISQLIDYIFSTILIKARTIIISIIILNFNKLNSFH